MTWMPDIFRRTPTDRELAREFEAHLAERIDDLLDGGMPKADARRQAMREFGNRTRYIEDSRAVWHGVWLEMLWQELRSASHTLRRQPSFSASAILILALGIGLVTALFAVFNATLLRQWPVEDPSAIVLVRPQPSPGQEYGVLSNAEFRYFREHTRSFSQLACSIQGGGSVAREDGSPIADVQSNYVTANYFDALGVGVAAGRGFLPDDEDYRRPRPVVIISERLWRESFGNDPAVVGHSIRVRDQVRTVIGVAEAGFSDVNSNRIDLWLPLPTVSMVSGSTPDKDQLAGFDDPRQGGGRVFGRLAHGMSRQQAQAELHVLSRQFRAPFRMDAPGMLLTDTRLISTGVSTGQLSVLGLLFVALFLVMLLACANVANLNLARAMRRQREIAIRLSLGASRRRVTMQLLTESLVLSLIAGSMGLYLAITIPQLLLRWGSPLTRSNFLAPDPPVFGFAFGMSVLACVLSGLAPALRVTRPNLATSANDRHTSSAPAGRLRMSLLATQIALTTVLLVGAGLLTRVMTHAMSIDPGFAVSDVQVFTAQGDAKSPLTSGALRDLNDNIKAANLPRVAFSMYPPISSARMSVFVRRPDQSREMNRLMLLRLISASYFDVLRIPMVSGRTLVDGNGPRELVVSRAAARRLWPNENAVGKRLLSGAGEKPENMHEIVGVAADVPTTRLTEIEPVIYQASDWARLVLIRDASPAIQERIQAIAQATSPGFKILRRSMTDEVRVSLMDLVIGSRVAWGLGVLALVLATMGAFGVFAYLVEERRREIGIRMALGARGTQVARLVLGAAGRPIIVGLVVGLALSLGGAQLMRSALYGMSPFDPIAYVQIAAILIVAAIAATWIPVLRATRVEPAITLREE
jgi:predicted permease